MKKQIIFIVALLTLSALALSQTIDYNKVWNEAQEQNEQVFEQGKKLYVLTSAKSKNIHVANSKALLKSKVALSKYSDTDTLNFSRVVKKDLQKTDNLFEVKVLVEIPNT